MMDTVTITQRHLPPELRGLPCIRAEVAHVIAPGKATPSLEGPIFDRHGNFYCCLTAPNDTYVKKISLDGSISDFFHSDSGMTVGLVFHQDGRCFAADMLRNCIRILSADGKLLEELPLQYEGRKLRPDCMVFDRKGDLLFTDLSGTFRDPIGGVYRLTQDSGYHELSLYVGNLASPDGITLSPDGKSLWVSECSSNSVLRFLLDGQGEPRIAQHTPLQAYRNSGASNVDTHAMDENGYLYLGIMMGGRAVVLDRDGIPVANILAPGFEEGKLLYTPNLALSRTDRFGYLLASDSEQAVVLRFPTFVLRRQDHPHVGNCYRIGREYDLCVCRPVGIDHRHQRDDLAFSRRTCSHHLPRLYGCRYCRCKFHRHFRYAADDRHHRHLLGAA